MLFVYLKFCGSPFIWQHSVYNFENEHGVPLITENELGKLSRIGNYIWSKFYLRVKTNGTFFFLISIQEILFILQIYTLTCSLSEPY